MQFPFWSPRNFRKFLQKNTNFLFSDLFLYGKIKYHRKIKYHKNAYYFVS